VILLERTGVKDLAKRIASSKTRKRKIRYRSEKEFLALYASLKFSSRRRNFSPGRFRSCLLKAAKGAIIFHLRYRAPYLSRARVEETDAATSSREWKITGDNKFYEEAPFPAESPFRPMIRFADKIADKDGDCWRTDRFLECSNVLPKNPFSWP